MSNKKVIWDADAAIRKACPFGMEQGTKLTIEYIVGFELFNTRRYHNYETWSTGYRVSGPAGPVGSDWPDAAVIVAESEDLDDALSAWVSKRDAAKSVLEDRKDG